MTPRAGVPLEEQLEFTEHSVEITLMHEDADVQHYHMYVAILASLRRLQAAQAIARARYPGTTTGEEWFAHVTNQLDRLIDVLLGDPT